MADVLDMQAGDMEPAPGEEKASNISIRNFFCRNSIISLSLCYVK